MGHVTLGSLKNGAAVTPSDDTNLANASQAVWIGTAGHLKYTPFGQSTPVTLANVPVGLWPIAAIRIWTVSGSATDIIALW